jgi:hypothetical protein
MSAKKEDKVENSKFSGSAYNYSDVDELIGKPTEKQYINRNKEVATDVDRKTKALVVQLIGRFDSTYILYSYVVDGVEYAFLWETYYDESHRGRGGSSKSAWYDNVMPGDEFEIKYSSGDPRKHYIKDKKMKFDGALFAGKK